MKKILHMTPPDINNGVYKYVFNQMKYIDQSRYRFGFLTRNEKDLMATKEYQQYHFNIQSFQNTERESKGGLREEITHILSQGYDTIHLHTSIWRGFLIEEIAMELKIPQVIVHSHSTGIDFSSQEDRDRLFRIHEQYKSAFDMSKATDICACSELAGEWLYGSQIPRNLIKIMPNAIEVEKYHFQPEVRRELRNKLGLSNRVVIGNVGRYCYQKNQEFLVKAFSKAYKNNKNIFLLLIGEGELQEEIRKLVVKLGIEDSVLCLNWQENVEEYLQIMDTFCLPSHFEGLPISVIEAQAAGLPCYVADTITREVKITDLVTFLPLIEEEWQYILEQSNINNNREHFDDEISKNGYDVRNAAVKLEQLYDFKNYKGGS